MKENKYDDEKFFHQYSQMSRSMDGLKGAGEWHALQKILPDFQGKRVLDLGCGFGWHCQYAIEHGAVHALGIDLSHKMLEEATKRNNSPRIEYKCMAIEDFDYTPESYDIVISSLTFHYLELFPDICEYIKQSLKEISVGIGITHVINPRLSLSNLSDETDIKSLSRNMFVPPFRTVKGSDTKVRLFQTHTSTNYI